VVKCSYEIGSNLISQGLNNLEQSDQSKIQMIKKDFDKWNNDKKGLDHKSKNVFFHDREVWWCKIGVNVGDRIIWRL